jgi:predicted NBD/HSP70 family sugar kinase
MVKGPRANRDLIRAINRSRVLNTIKNQGPVSRTSIAHQTGLSAATITSISSELIESGLIFEKEAGDSSGGRRPILLALNTCGGCVIGLKLAEDHVAGALTDLRATVSAKLTRPLTNQSIDSAIDTMSKVVESLLGQKRYGKEQFLGVGVGLAGIIDHQRNVLRHSPIFGWNNVPLGDLLADRLGVPIYIDNDVNTLTITELWFGKGKGVDNFLTVSIGRGVGLGIVLNGQVYLGMYGGAGEFGHTVIDPQGPTCACGKKGCLETFVSDPALMSQAAVAIEQGDIPAETNNIEDLLALAQGGHQVALKIFAEAGQVLGFGIANLINLFNPELIIISGEGVRAGDLLFEQMRATVSANVMPGLVGDTTIHIDPWDDYAWARGAAGLVLRELFESPIHRTVSSPV